MTFREMLAEVCKDMDLEQRELAAALGVSQQYASDIVTGRRLPSVRITNAICDWLGRGPEGRREWHIAAARARGWEV